VLDSNGGSGTYILNNFYSADKGTYKSGTITYPFSNLSDGKYHLTVTVWDVDDSSAKATTDFIVANSSNLTIGKIFNYPNPFSNITNFGFDDNEPDKTLHVDISIYDMRGKLIRDLQSDVMSAGDQQTIQWNGTTYGGAPIAAGMYVYRLTISDADGQVAEKSQKLIFIK
jgi:flagellar hook assembly protein FlgD